MIEAQKKKKHVRKHIVGMLVKDEPGVLARIAGLFSRRGFNINTIVVGKTNLENTSHIVISLEGDDRVIEQLDKQLYKLIDVLKLADFSETNAIVREHCLLKINSTEKSRSDIINICKLHHVNVLHANHDNIIVEITSEPKKIDELIEILNKYGIKEMSRTGINALQKD